MRKDLEDRLDEMLPDADQENYDAALVGFTEWVTFHAEAVRSMGRPNRMMAHVAMHGTAASARVECAFTNYRGETYSVNIAGGGRHELRVGEAQTLDAPAAMNALGALLAELGMLAALS